MKYVFEKYDVLTSTNDTAKRKAAEGSPEGTVIVAARQTAGRGRAGHSFYSPQGGLYMSLILRPSFDDMTLITTAAAAAVCRALEKLGFDARIKWVNDVYVKGKKVCGILTESNVALGWAVLGVGVNTADPGPDAPPVAGGLYGGECDNDGIARLILGEFGSVYMRLPEKSYLDYYREKSLLTGKNVVADGVEYVCLGIGDDLSLILSGKNGVRRIRCGEVSVKPV